MTINIPGCKTVNWTSDEQATAQELSDLYSRVAEVRLNMPRGSLLVEFTKAVAIDASVAGFHTRYTDEAPFYAMEIKAQGDATLNQDNLRLGLLEIAFNTTSARVSSGMTPVLYRNYRGDFRQKTTELLAEMF
ncbi:MAG: hypothetical protein LRY76_06970 [Alphaproteobacteria bacterium]|nr:hypothetical protein [Alphaproteobacteria bacterium]